MKETTIRLLDSHDVGLVHSGDLLAAMVDGIVESELGDSSRLLSGRDLERLDHSADRLVLQSAVLALGLLSDDDEVDVVVAELQAWHTLDAHNVREQIELQANTLIHRLEPASLADSRRGEYTFETDFVALEARDEIFDRGASAWQQLGGHDLLEFDWHADVLEDLAHAQHELWADACGQTIDRLDNEPVNRSYLVS